MGHARETYACDYAHESVEDTLGYKNIVQLSVDVPNVSWKFSASLKEQTKRT